MKIAIISDSHDNVANIEKFLVWTNANQVAMIIHCGDITAPAIVSKVLAPNFSGPIHLVHGNVSDRELLESVCQATENIQLHGDMGEIFLPLNNLPSGRQGREDRRGPNNLPPSNSPLMKGGEKDAKEELRIAFCHFPEPAKELAESGKYSLVFYGHSHKPWMETLANHCQLINPGTLGGLFQKPTFAVYDTAANDLQLKILEKL